MQGQPSRTTLCLLIGLALVPYFLMLGTPPLWDANEPLYAQPPKEVLEWEEGDFLAPTWNGKPYFAHPPLSTWITVPFYAWLGADEFGERFPMALAALLTILATFRLGQLAGGRRIGLLAALILAATPRFWFFSRQLSGDVFLVALLTWAWLLAVPAVSGRDGRRSLCLANVLVGVGFLAKGPIILVLYGGGLLLTWLCAKERAPMGRLRPLRGTLLIVAVGAPWFVYMSLRYPASDLDFFGQYFGHYTFGRVTGNIGHRGLLFYPRILLGDAQPWLTLLPFAAWIAWKRRDRSVAALLPWVAMLFIVLFFSASAGKRNVYMMPLYPLLAVAVAPLASAVWDGAHRAGVRLAGVGAAVGCFVCATLLFMLSVNEPRLRPEIFWLVGLLAAAGLPGLVAGWRGAGRLLVGGTLAVLLGALAATAFSFPALARFKPVPRMAERVLREERKDETEPVIIYRAAIHSMNFYLGRATRVAGDPHEFMEKLGDAETAFVLCHERRFDAPAPQGGDGERVGLKHELPDLEFEELERLPILSFRFDRSVLGRGSTTRDLLLLRVSRIEKTVAGDAQGPQDRPPR